MKFLFLLYACAEKFRAAKIDAINVSLSPKASMAEFHAAKREDAMKFLEFLDARSFGLRAAERRFEILKFLNARHFGSHKQAAGRRSEILKFTAARSFGLRTTTTGFLNLTPAPPRNEFKILKFTPEPLRNRFGILKFTRTSARLADTAQNFISQRGFKILKLVCEPLRAPRRILPRADKAEAWHGCDIAEKRRAVKFNHAGGYLNFMRCRIVRLYGAAARHGYEVGRAEKLSKFDLAGTLLNFKSRFTMQLCSAVTRRNYEAWRSEIYAVCLHKYPALIRAASGKISHYEVGQATNASLSRGVQRMKFYALNRHAIKFLKFLGASCFGSQTAAWFLKFKPEVPRNEFKILKFTPEPLRNRFGILKFTPELRKFKPASAVRLNFALNSVPRARAAKFENGVKFKGAAKFERSAR
ncbi:hypothetical protein [Campylobacter sp.]|uniref:hypothetical protein n=1 Tax=Campylobacter sp. TaxID=205 RepID=UPI0025C0BE63|nr:hypothetical protein [Campylobacter sp.]